MKTSLSAVKKWSVVIGCLFMKNVFGMYEAPSNKYYKAFKNSICKHIDIHVTEAARKDCIKKIYFEDFFDKTPPNSDNYTLAIKTLTKHTDALQFNIEIVSLCSVFYYHYLKNTEKNYVLMQNNIMVGEEQIPLLVWVQKSDNTDIQKKYINDIIQIFCFTMPHVTKTGKKTVCKIEKNSVLTFVDKESLTEETVEYDIQTTENETMTVYQEGTYVNRTCLLLEPEKKKLFSALDKSFNYNVQACDDEDMQEGFIDDVAFTHNLEDMWTIHGLQVVLMSSCYEKRDNYEYEAMKHLNAHDIKYQKFNNQRAIQSKDTAIYFISAEKIKDILLKHKRFKSGMLKLKISASTILIHDRLFSRLKSNFKMYVFGNPNIVLLKHICIANNKWEKADNIEEESGSQATSNPVNSQQPTSFIHKIINYIKVSRKVQIVGGLAVLLLSMHIWFVYINVQ